MVAQAKHDFEQFVTYTNVLQPYTGELRNKAILDVGCGRLYPQSLLLHSRGNAVTGIDSAHIGPNEGILKRYWRTLTKEGIESLGRDFLYAVLLKNRTYYHTLQDVSGFTLSARGLDIRRMNAEDLTFREEAFDVVISIAVFEHIQNVPKAVSEIHRVLKPGGVAYVNIHLFASLSGGHLPALQNPAKMPSQPQLRVPAWDHLREDKHRIPGHLNRLREHQYTTLFGTRFTVLQVLNIGEGEGKQLLTPEIRQELSDYTEDELTKRGITIIARKD